MKRIILISFGEYDSYSSEFSILINGFAFNNILRNYENDITNYLNIVDGLK